MVARVLTSLWSQKSTGWKPAVGLAVSIVFGILSPVDGQIVRGQVADSITDAPIPGAAVSMLNESGTVIEQTITDMEGLFLVRAPQAGMYSLRVEADAIRTSEFPPFALAGEQMLGFKLLVASTSPPALNVDPTVEQLLDNACGTDFDGNQPVILGRVTQDESNAPVDGAEVVMSWSAVPEFLHARVGYENAAGAALTGSSGFYAICGAPTATSIVIHAEVTSQGRLSEFLTLRFENNGVFVGDSFHVMTHPIWRQDFSLIPGSELTGTIRGTVHDTTGARLANARVTALGTNIQTRANVLGDFELTSLPPGTIRIAVEQVGHRPYQTDVHLKAGEQLTLGPNTVALANAPIELDPIVVETDRPDRRRELAEFEKRRETTSGSFLTREEWESMGAVDETVDVLRRLRGLRINPGPNMTQPWIITSTRSGGRGGFTSGLTGGQCFPLVFLDNRYLGSTGQISVDREIRLLDLEAVEFHTSTAGMPAELNRPGAVCGVLVFWTR